MPEYVDHPVKDKATWERDVKWRLDPEAPGRFDGRDEHIARARAAAARGEMIVANMIGGYMYLRSLIGPEDLLYAFVDQPDLIHDRPIQFGHIDIDFKCKKGGEKQKSGAWEAPLQKILPGTLRPPWPWVSNCAWGP